MSLLVDILYEQYMHYMLYTCHRQVQPPVLLTILL